MFWIINSSPSLIVADPNIELGVIAVGAVLFHLPCWLFSLLSFVLFLPNIRGVCTPLAPPIDLPLLKLAGFFSNGHFDSGLFSHTECKRAVWLWPSWQEDKIRLVPFPFRLRTARTFLLNLMLIPDAPLIKLWTPVKRQPIFLWGWPLCRGGLWYNL